jgi:hypothetical protein
MEATMTKYLIVIGLAACNLKPLVADTPADGADAPQPDAAPADAPTNVLPKGTPIPSIAENSELITQIRLNDGLSDAALSASGGVVTRSTGKSGGATVRYWNFGPATVEANNIPVLAPLYVFGTVDPVSSAFTPLTDHPPLIDTICGDTRYSALRRVVDVPVTDKYAGERITTMAALADAIDLGLVGDPVPDGTWVNMPVVLPGTTLEVADDPTVTPPLATTQVYGRGYVVDVFELGTSVFGRQPLKSGFETVPVGQDDGLQSGVATGNPPVKSTAIDPQLVFQQTIPTAAPTSSPNYTPLATDVTVRLADGVDPTQITSDSQLFKRSAGGAITGFFVGTVETFTVNTTTNNLQLQFVEGMP